MRAIEANIIESKTRSACGERTRRTHVISSNIG
jgi:hypothetical protein